MQEHNLDRFNNFFIFFSPNFSFLKVTFSINRALISTNYNYSQKFSFSFKKLSNYVKKKSTNNVDHIKLTEEHKTSSLELESAFSDWSKISDEIEDVSKRFEEKINQI